MRTGSLVATAFSIAAFHALPANGADFGSDCCADLEERVAELEATAARKGNRKVALKLYGNINQAVMWWDDGTEQNTYVVANKTTRSVFGFEGRAQIDPQISAGYLIEIELRGASSDLVDQSNDEAGSDLPGGSQRPLILSRQSNWWIEHRQLGRITVGLVSNATDGIAEIDLSGSASAAGSSVEAWNENFFLRDKESGVPVLPLFGTVGGRFIDLYRGNLDGGVGNFVRYDTPVVAGFIASVAWGEDDDWDAALRYAAEFGGFQLSAGIGYHSGQTMDTNNFGIDADHNEWVGSASALHIGTGLFVTFAAGSREWDFPGLSGEDYVYAKSGFFRQLVPLGKTSIYGEYYHIQDVGVDPFVGIPGGEESASMWGTGIVQHIDAAAMEIYLAYRHYWADNVTDTSGSPTIFTDHSIEMDMVMGGARIRF